MAELKLNERQERLLAEAKQQHYVVAACRQSKRDRKLRNAYWDWCLKQAWCPYILVTIGPRYATVTLDRDTVHDDKGNWVVSTRPWALEQAWAAVYKMFGETVDHWARDAVVAGYFYLHGMPIDLVPQFIDDVWPVLSVPRTYITDALEQREVNDDS